MTIRDATVDDVAVIHQLIQELAAYEHLEHAMVATADDIREHLFGPEAVASAIVAETEGRVAGFALFFRTFSTFSGRSGIWLEDLFVLPVNRGQGLGGQLLSELRGRTAGRVEWAVLNWNRPSIEFYQHLGATPVEGWTTYRWLPAS
jgi:GNAT superfamily N-acetyltransferase